jgi:hypothetical protein
MRQRKVLYPPSHFDHESTKEEEYLKECNEHEDRAIEYLTDIVSLISMKTLKVDLKQKV